MPVVITCPACQRKARIPDTALGKMVKCPGCAATFPATIDDETPARHPPESEEVPEPAPEPVGPVDQSRQVERIGVGLLSISQGLLAVALAFQLLVALERLATSDGGPKSTFGESFTQLMTLVSTLAWLTAVISGLIGAVYCTLTPAATLARGAAGAVAVLGVLTAMHAPTNSLRDLFSGMGMDAGGMTRGGGRLPDSPFAALSGMLLLMALMPAAVEAGRQTMLAVLARLHARRLRDRAGAGMATVVAIAYPTVVIGLIVLGMLVGMFGSTPHPTFAQVLMVVELLAQTALVAWGCFVLWRVWARLRPD
jgi:hypothetical protein